MYARVFALRYRPGEQPSQQAAARYFDWYRRQPGQRGVVNIDTGDGGRIVVFLAESAAALEAISEERNEELHRIMEEHYRPIWTAEPQVLGEGPVLQAELQPE